jgi:hypothetical protein
MRVFLSIKSVHNSCVVIEKIHRLFGRFSIFFNYFENYTNLNQSCGVIMETGFSCSASNQTLCFGRICNIRYRVEHIRMRRMFHGICLSQDFHLFRLGRNPSIIRMDSSSDIPDSTICGIQNSFICFIVQSLVNFPSM